MVSQNNEELMEKSGKKSRGKGNGFGASWERKKNLPRQIDATTQQKQKGSNGQYKPIKPNYLPSIYFSAKR